MLTQRAEASGASPNLVARELFTEALTREDEVASQLSHLHLRVNDLNAKLQRLDAIERHLERGLYLLLRYAGKLDASKATTAVERCFSSQGTPGVESEYVVREKDVAGK